MSDKHILLAVALGIGIMVVASTSQASRVEHSFTIPRESETKVVEVMLTGGLAKQATLFQVSGDARLSMFTVSGYASGTPQLVFSEQLDEEAFRTMVGDLVGAGVMDYDEREMERRFGTALLPTDQRNTHLTLRLETYDGRALGQDGFVERRLSLEGARERARQFPEIAEVAAISRLLERLSDVARRHAARVR